MFYSFISPVKIIMGIGSLQKITEEVSIFGKKVGLVIGRSWFKRSQIWQSLKYLFIKDNIKVFTFEGISSEPSWSIVKKCWEYFKNKPVDCIVGIGGGSVIDVGKVVSALLHTENIDFYKKGENLNSPGVPFIAVPSTGGSGAEVTPNAVLIWEETGIKKSLRSSYLLPKVAIVDPQLSVSCPPDITAYAGIDAFSQAVESFISIRANPITEILCKEAIRLIVNNLERAFEDGKDLYARKALSYAALLSGISLANTGLGVVHGIAHSLGVECKLPHGLAVALLLPAGLKFNMESVREKYKILASVINKNHPEEFIEFIKGLLKRLKIPLGLEKMGIKNIDFSTIAYKSLISSNSIKSNPRNVNMQDIINILKDSIRIE